MGKLGIFDEDAEIKKWIQFDEDTEVLIKFIGKEEFREIQKKAEKTARLSGVPIADILDQKVGRHSVLGWRKINDTSHPGLIVDSKPFPFSPENVDFLMRKSLEFSNFVNNNVLDSRVFLEDEEEIKN